MEEGTRKVMEWIRRYILKDLKLKLLSLLLAVLLWVAVSYVGESKTTLSLRVHPVGLPSGLIITNMDDEVLVTLDGPVSALKNLRGRDVKVSLDLSGVRKGRHVLNLGKDNVQAPKGLKVETVKPDLVVIEVGTIAGKRLRVVAKLSDKWMTKYRIKSWDPRYVFIEGAREALESRVTIDTLPVDGDFRRKDEEADVGLDLDDLTVARVQPPTIRVSLRRN